MEKKRDRTQNTRFPEKEKRIQVNFELLEHDFERLRAYVKRTGKLTIAEGARSLVLNDLTRDERQQAKWDRQQKKGQN
jgi:hypothetical protein